MLIDSQTVARLVECAIPRLACELPADVSAALHQARRRETEPLPSFALGVLCANDSVSRMEGAPICQDTGTVWVCLEIGPDVTVSGDVLSMVDYAVARAYTASRLRKSLVKDALYDRSNSEDNTPAFCELHASSTPGARMHIMLKGGGSDNASRVCMLPPGSGREGIVAEVVRCVREKGANACPPLVVGVGIGATFDKVAGLAKRALMRPLGEAADDAAVAALEAELTARVNETGVGASGLGGMHTALAVHVETAPCHIAALPVAINMGCCALRRATIEITEQMARGEVQNPGLISGCPLDGCDKEETDAQDAVSAFGGLTPLRISLPLDADEAARLKAGDACLLSGPLYTLRDAGHMRLLGALEEGSPLPFEPDGQCIFYAGPTPAACDRPFGAIGPTTASRMDFAAPRLYAEGVRATIGKGRRSEAVRMACKNNGSVYFVTIGGAAAYLANCVVASELVAYEDLGTEALRRVIVRDLPAIVGIDSNGECIYD